MLRRSISAPTKVVTLHLTLALPTLAAPPNAAEKEFVTERRDELLGKEPAKP